MSTTTSYHFYCFYRFVCPLSKSRILKEKDHNNDLNSIYEFLSDEVKAKHEGIKLLVRWIFGLKLNSILVIQENQADANSKFFS